MTREEWGSNLVGMRTVVTYFYESRRAPISNYATGTVKERTVQVRFFDA